MSFLTYLRRDLEQIFFKDRDPHAIPSMDGAFSPNDRLEHTMPIGEPLPEADAVAEASDGSLCVSAGNRVWRLQRGGLCKPLGVSRVRLRSRCSGVHPDGRLLACTARGLAAIDSAGRKTLLAEAEGEAAGLPDSGCRFAPDGTIFVTDGSTRHPPPTGASI